MKHFYKNITGWFDFDAIYDMAIEQAKDGDILVETGTANGKSICYLGVEAINSGKDLKIFTIDISENEHQVNYVKEQIKGLPVTFINADSIKTAEQFDDGSVFMIFLDADHTYEFLSAELRAWHKKLKPDGILAGHDWDNGYPGIQQALKEYIKEFGGKLIINKSSWIYERG